MSFKDISDLLLWKRCVFMTFDQYKNKKEHINERIYYHQAFTNDIKKHVIEHLKGLADKLPFKRVPKPIYVLVAKHLEYDSDDSILPADCKNLYDDLNNNVVALKNIQYDTDKGLNAEKYVKYNLSCIKSNDKWIQNSDINTYTFIYNNFGNSTNKDELMQSSLASYKFKGLYEVIIYVPNLNKNMQYFTSFMDFSYQNRWMHLIVSKQSKHLTIIPFQKDYEEDIIKLVGLETYKKNREKYTKIIDEMNAKDRDEYPLAKDLTHVCFQMGCSAPYGEDLDELVPTVSKTYDGQLSNARAKGPYYPTKCLKTDYYSKHMMQINETEYKKGLKESLVKNVEGFQKNYEKIKNGEIPSDEYSSTNLIDVIKGTASRYRNETYKEGSGDNEYSKEYNRKIMAELAFRHNAYPGVQEITFPAFRINDNFTDLQEYTHYMPWGNILLKNEYVLNEGDALQIDEVSLKSFDKRFQLKFDNEGLSLFLDSKKIKTIIKGNFTRYSRKTLVFENGSLNIYGYINGNNDNRFSMYVSNADAISPLSMVLENNGDINIYENGFNVIGKISEEGFVEKST